MNRLNRLVVALLLLFAATVFAEETGGEETAAKAPVDWSKTASKNTAVKLNRSVACAVPASTRTVFVRSAPVSLHVPSRVAVAALVLGGCRLLAALLPCQLYSPHHAHSAPLSKFRLGNAQFPSRSVWG